MLQLLLVCCFLLQYSSATKKCCGEDTFLRLTNSTYACSVNATKRFHINASTFNFFNANKTDFRCTDVSEEGIFVYSIRNGSLVDKEIVVEDKVFKKCCPDDYVYNTYTHSCQNITDHFIKNVSLPNTTFFEVGLKECKVIKDKEFYKYEQINVSEKTHCIDVTQRNTFVLRECEENMEICKSERCVKKCCPDGQSFVMGSHCKDTFVHGIDFNKFEGKIENPEDNFTVVYNTACPKMYPWSDSIIFTLTKDGTLRYWHNYTVNFIEENVYNKSSYCIDHAINKKGKNLGYRFFYCSQKVELDKKYLYSKWSKILSCIGLVLTIFIYVLLDETKTLFGKLLVNYCLATLGTMIILLYAHSMPTSETPLQCHTRAFFLILFSNAQFTLLNAMGLNIWWNFGSPRQTFNGDSRRRNLKRVFLYLFYGWGVALLLSVLPFIFMEYKVLPEVIQPYIGSVKCFWEDRAKNYATALFYNFPHLLIEICNTVLCVKTIMYCLKVKDEINRRNDSNSRGKKKIFNTDKERLKLIVKLAVIMGVSFLFEVVSAFFNEKMKQNVYVQMIEIIWDNINLLQGVYIFIIFICKKKILNDLKLKLKMSKRKISSSTTHSINTQSTDTTTFHLNATNGSRKILNENK